MKLTVKQTDIALGSMAALLFLYTCIRAMRLSITWDEAYTYIEFARNGKVFLRNYEMMSANNHLLNTALMVVFTKLFGLHEFAMRMPALMAHLLFLFFSARLLRNFDNRWLALSAFVILNVNPYLLDFFSLARGYGLSLGLMMASIYFFYLACTGVPKGRWSMVSMLFASLAVFANFVLLNYCLVLFGLLWLNAIRGAEATPLKAKVLAAIKNMAAPAIIMGGLLCVVIPVTLKLKEAGALFFGGESSFWSDTISTVTARCLYDQGYGHWIERIIKGFVLLVVLLAAVYYIWLLLRKKAGTVFFPVAMQLLLVLCSASTVVQHHLLHTPYLMDRTALFLVVLFTLVFVFFIGEVLKVRPAAAIAAHGSALLLLVHFVFCFNLGYVLEWKLDANTKEMLSDIEKIKKIPAGKETISIGIPLTFDPAINFYREKNNLLWLNTAWRNETGNMLHDYFCLRQQDLPEMNMDSVEIIKTYPSTGNILARPKYSPKEIKAELVRQLNFEAEKEGHFTMSPSIEYSPGFSYIVNDSITPDRSAVLAFYAEVQANDLSCNNLVMVLSFQDANGKLYSWQKAYVKDFIRNTTGWFRCSFTCIVPAGTKAGDEIKAYIWNPDKQGLFIRKMEFRWLAYKYR
ncbi:MAG: hypothetical protein JWO09_1937 [Bacteroidetes bacterium]|nr:hypothetical protein [Bacteroidota bacterium]